MAWMQNTPAALPGISTWHLWVELSSPPSQGKQTLQGLLSSPWGWLFPQEYPSACLKHISVIIQ